MMDLKDLIKGLKVYVETPENKAGGKEKFREMAMLDYLELIGKTVGDLDEPTVRQNLDAIWVAREGTGELPGPFPADYFQVIDVPSHK